MKKACGNGKGSEMRKEEVSEEKKAKAREMGGISKIVPPEPGKSRIIARVFLYCFVFYSISIS